MTTECNGVEVTVNEDGTGTIVYGCADGQLYRLEFRKIVLVDERPCVLYNTLSFEVETWDDPGDYPSNAGAGPLPSYKYAVCDGEVRVYGDFDLDSLVPSGFEVTKWKEHDDGVYTVKTCELLEDDYAD